MLLCVLRVCVVGFVAENNLIKIHRRRNFKLVLRFFCKGLGLVLLSELLSLELT